MLTVHVNRDPLVRTSSTKPVEFC